MGAPSPSRVEEGDVFASSMLFSFCETVYFMIRARLGSTTSVTSFFSKAERT